MKIKVIVLVMLLFLASGCKTVKTDSLDDIAYATLNSNLNITNINRVGYKYYLPKGVKVIEQVGSNEILKDGKVSYYLYVDLVSFYNKKEIKKSEAKEYYYLRDINSSDSKGYILIRELENNKYFIEIVYNYAKIEVMVSNKKYLNSILAKSLSILTSITYQSDVVSSLMAEDLIESSETEFNIFQGADTKSEYLEIIKEYGTYSDKQEKVDPDFIHN